MFLLGIWLLLLSLMFVVFCVRILAVCLRILFVFVFCFDMLLLLYFFCFLNDVFFPFFVVDANANVLPLIIVTSQALFIGFECATVNCSQCVTEAVSRAFEYTFYRRVLSVSSQNLRKV